LQVNKNWSKGRTARHIFGRPFLIHTLIMVNRLMSSWHESPDLTSFSWSTHFKFSSMFWYLESQRPAFSLKLVLKMVILYSWWQTVATCCIYNIYHLFYLYLKRF
jgi:hypothetical protein